MPSALMQSPNSLIDLITKIFNADIDKDPGIFSRYDHLWCTMDPSLGDRYMVSGGDMDELSYALDSVYKEQGLLISSLDCRDIDGRVLIGFRWAVDPKSRRYATIYTATHNKRYMSAEWKECLGKLKQEMAAAIKKDSPSVSVASRGLRVPDSKVSGTGSAKPITLSSKRTLATQGTAAPTAIAERMRLMHTHNIIVPSPTRPQETKEAVSAVDGGAQQCIVVAAEPHTKKEQRISAPLVEGEWIAVDVHVNEEDEWTVV